jgi:predicted membrane protein
MNLYDISFSIFCVILILLILFGVSKNILTKYGVWLLVSILILGIISYDILASLQVREVIQKIDLADADTKK